MSRVLFSIWFTIQGIIQSKTCSLWFRIQRIIKKNVHGIIQRLVHDSGYYSIYDLQRLVRDSGYYSKYDLQRLIQDIGFVLLLLQICFFFVMREKKSRENQADIIEAFNSTSRYLDDLLNIDNIYFDQMVDRIYPTELQLNRTNSSDTEAPFLDLNLCISNDTVSTKIYDKRDDFDFDIVNFPFLDGDVPRRTSYGVYISQLIRFARASSNLNDFNYRNKALTAKLLRQGNRYFKLRKAFSKFYRRHSALLEKYSVSLKTLLQQGISEPEFYGDLVYIFRKIVGKSNFSEQFRKLINRYKRIGYSLDIMRQTACLVVNPIIVDG